MMAGIDNGCNSELKKQYANTLVVAAKIMYTNDLLLEQF